MGDLRTNFGNDSLASGQKIGEIIKEVDNLLIAKESMNGFTKLLTYFLETQKNSILNVLEKFEKTGGCHINNQPSSRIPLLAKKVQILIPEASMYPGKSALKSTCNPGS